MNRSSYRTLLVVLLLSTTAQVSAQNLLGQDSLRTITTAMPFLTIAPDARAGALGDAGVSTSADINSLYWNPAKMAYLEKYFGFAVSYTPWLRGLTGINDVYLAYLSGYYKINERSTVSGALNYFNLGNIQFTDNVGAPGIQFTPRELSITAGYAQQLGDRLSVGVGVKFINSNLAGQSFNVAGGGNSARPANGAAADIGVFYTNDDMALGGSPLTLNFGASITNLGPKVTYSSQEDNDFLPTTLRLGVSPTFEIDPYNSLSLVLEASKLLVPTPPVRDRNGTIVRGQDPDRGFFSGVFSSFSDAPDGSSEELREFMLSAGVEYWYNDLFAARAGYFHENNLKGGRQYFSVGAGLRYQLFGVDFAYLVPLEDNHPLAETLRFTLHFEFERGANTGAGS
ncbi:MAG: type IX secretion system outer membrane channel protein PorV [Catalinimonas sp.]